MAPVSEAFFASLDKCFSGDAQLLSWRRVFLHLCEPDDNPESRKSIEQFLTHPESTRLLSDCLAPFPTPSAKSKTEFESKTAAIHVETSSKAAYNLDEIKADALWLSHKAEIDEVLALRIAVLEWQERPNIRITSRFTEEEATSLQDATGGDNFRLSLAGPQLLEILKTTAREEDGSASFSSERCRRIRLQKIYISEKAHILKTARKLLSLSLHDLLPSDADYVIPRDVGTAPKTLDSLGQLGKTIFTQNDTEDSRNRFLQSCIQEISTRIHQFQGEGGWLSAEESSEEVESTWRTSIIDEITHAMQILYLQTQASNSIPTADLLLSWLTLMADCSFLESVPIPCEDPSIPLLSLQALVSTTTLALLKLSRSIAFIWQNAQLRSEGVSQSCPYFLSRARIAEINEIFLNCVSAGVLSASPAIFAWGMILHSMRDLGLSARETREMEQFRTAVSSFQSNTPAASPSRGPEQTLYEDLLDLARVPVYGDDFVDILTSGAIDNGHVFDVVISLATRIGEISVIDDTTTASWIRLSVLGLIRAATFFLDYSQEIVEATLAILNTGDTISPHRDCGCLSRVSDPKYVFFNDKHLMDRVFHVARSRFPYETLPFLKLSRALTSCNVTTEEGNLSMLTELEKMETFTQVVSPNFQGYETIREDENANLVSLVQPIPMLEAAPKRWKQAAGANDMQVVPFVSQIPPATTGQVISESKPAVIMWYHEYSCLAFLGRWLEDCADDGGAWVHADSDSIPEIIGLLMDLMEAVRKVRGNGQNESDPKIILELASDSLNSRGDIISVIFDILERNLQNLGTQAGARRPLDLVVSCLRFVNVLVPILPSRVWPFLARSSLIGTDDQGRVMSSIISACEVTCGDYPFLSSCVRLLDALVEDAISYAALRKSTNQVTLRTAPITDWSAGVPSHVMRNLLMTFVRTMTEAFNASENWRFNEPERRLELNTVLAGIFERILQYAYAIDEASKLDAKITGVFSSSASYILDVFRPTSNDNIPFNPLVRIVVDSLQAPTSTIYLRRLILISKHLQSSLHLAITLIRAASLTHAQWSLLEDTLFKASPVFAKLYASHEPYRLPVVRLLDMLVKRAASNMEHEPPSLLGHLGAESACLFLDVLAQFDQPLKNTQLATSVWHLLSTFVSKRQQWLAIYLLTGSSPRDSMKQAANGKKTPAMRGTPFLQIALDSLAHVEQVDPQLALSMLEFVSHSQEQWPWATSELEKHPSFFKDLVRFVSNLDLSKQSSMDRIFFTKIAALTADLCAVHLHYAKEARDKTFFKLLIPLVSWYARNAVDVGGYNASLHANLKKNFEMKYDGCRLSNFKRTALDPRTLGKEYYYHMYLADKMLSHDFSWVGSRNQGFSAEFERANMNLSLVDVQMNLFTSWKFLALEHSEDFMPEREVQKSMAMVVRNCLTANSRNVPHEAIFDKLQQSRVEFAVALLQRLVEVGSKGAEVFSLLGVAWDAMRDRGLTYENALIQDDTEYYRTLLNVLFLALQCHVEPPTRTSPAVLSKKPEISSDLSIVVELVKVVVAQGFKTLTTYLHDEPQKCSPKDFATITAIFQTALRVKNVERIYEQLVFHIEDNDTARYANTLFSWSDQLTVDGDPIYGELSVLFLVELSTLPMLAEHLAVESVLMRLSTSRLTNVLGQPKGCGPFDPIPRLYAIWTGGMLPLCLNLLYHVTRAAPEVAAFLNQFEGQLNRAADSFTGVHAPLTASHLPKRICLAMASEAYSLSLISFILARYREAGPSAGVDGYTIQELKWDKAQLKEDIQDLLGRRSSLRSRIVATNEKELELAKQKPVNASTSGAESRLEEKIVAELSSALACLAGGEETT